MAKALPQIRWQTLAANAAVIAIIGVSLWPFAPQIVARLGQVRFDGPDWRLWIELSWVVKLHIATALSALVIGSIILMRPKGRGLHKALGWSWVIAMGVTAISSLFLTGLNGNFWSIIHLLSGWVIIALPMAIYAIRSRKVETHRRAMTGMFVGGLIVAGALTFIPGRFMFEFFFG